MSTRRPSRPVVVGVDGSHAAVSAAVWAVDEAVRRDVPLRLTCVVDGADDAGSAARDLATAEIAVRECIVAIETDRTPVKIEVEIRQGDPTAVLIEASRSAVMLCVGATGREHTPGAALGAHIGELTSAAHCPVAVIRPDSSALDTSGVVAEIDDSCDIAAVLEHGVAEARGRHATLSILSTWQPRFTDIHDTQARAAGNRRTRAGLERKLDWLRRKHPDLTIKMAAAQGSTTTYLHRHAASVDLLIVGRTRRDGLCDLIGSAGHATLIDTMCSVLVCPPRSTL
ncbi:universal stress protein [Mycolicibacterium fluoranthenivorans]|uniref:Nucleotide-binding universal stress protein, UspA family n=1 Tax=Mycolicibacterium fluoranthenivorans TaxID=258505 RepID=A0A1G4WRB4_9MYCO|nr:universal stress protein [Mycolicibacterium fluoranthenivorans]SCX27839.1 Nucleotide-binding universal stress protein, UspA family [Mycolicibacterium fluoranthenivorans]